MIRKTAVVSALAVALAAPAFAATYAVAPQGPAGVQVAQAATPAPAANPGAAPATNQTEGTKHLTGKLTKIDMAGRMVELGNDTYYVRTTGDQNLDTLKVGDDVELAFVEAGGRKEIISIQKRDMDQKPVGAP